MKNDDQPDTKKEIAGGCACGAVRYELAQAPDQAGACHCGMCRRWAGGGPFLGFQTETAKVTKPDGLALWKSSSWGERAFCSKCGTSLFWRLQSGKGNWVVTTSTLDEPPAGLKVAMHIYIDDKPGYYDFDDDARRMTGEEFTEMVFSEMKLPMRLMAKFFYALSKLKPSGKPDVNDEAAAKRGSCNCDAVKFSLPEAASEISFCQCPVCLKSHGGVAGLWAQAEGLKFDSEEALSWWTDPDGIERGFCNKCGSSLAKRKKDSAEAEIAVGALENSLRMTGARIAHGGDAASHLKLVMGDTAKDQAA